MVRASLRRLAAVTAKSPRCRCGHPKGKHARGARGGCTVRVPRAGRTGRKQFIDWPCLVFAERELPPADVSRETSVLQIIALDRARLAAAADEGRVSLVLGGPEPGIYLDGKKID